MFSAASMGKVIEKENVMIYEMFRSQFVPKEELPYLRGGQIKGPDYFVVTEIDDVMLGKLRVQSATQVFPAFPHGFEPFVFSHGEEKFCNEKQTISIPRLAFLGNQKFGGIFKSEIRINAGILCPGAETEEWFFLNRHALRFDWQCHIRRYVWNNKRDFEIVLDLLREGGPDSAVRSLKGTTDLFERRLAMASDARLESLSSLLTVPGLLHSPQNQLAA